MANGDTTPDAEESGGVKQWLGSPWYQDRLGRSIVALDLVLTIALVVLTMGHFGGALDEPLDFADGVIPAFIYVFVLLGALGYVFTTLTDDFHRTTGDIIQYNFRLPAALPLGAGIYLLAELILVEATQSTALLAGVVFLSGLYVNLAYVRMGALAERLLPDKEEATTGEAS